MNASVAYGNLGEEIDLSAQLLEELPGGGTGLITVTTIPLSIYLGNPGLVCTWSYECVLNCRQ